MVAEFKDSHALSLSGSSAEQTDAPASQRLRNQARGSERRREPRFPCNDPVTVRVIPGDGSLVPATLMDVSRSGVRIEIGLPLPKNTQIEIHLSKQLVVSGRVRHSRRVGTKYQSGVFILETVDESKPSEHVSDEQLSSYLSGQTRAPAEVIRVREHLVQCSACRLRIVDSYSVKPSAPRSSS